MSTPDPKNPESCPVKLHEDTYDPADGIESLGEAAKLLGMDEKCKEVVTNINSQKSSSDTTTAVVLSPFAVGGGSTQQNESESYIDTSTENEGCGTVSFTSTVLNNEQKTMTCMMNSTTTESTMTVEAGSSLSIIQLQPDYDITSSINSILQTMDETISQLNTEIAATMPPDRTELNAKALSNPNSNPAVVKILSDAMTENYEIQMKALQYILKLNMDGRTDFAEGNPLVWGMSGSTIRQYIDSEIQVNQLQMVSEDVEQKMKDSVKRIAKAVAVDKISQKIAAGATRDAAKVLVNTNIDQSIDDQKASINATITGNSLSAVNKNQIILHIYGPLVNSVIDQSLASQFKITVDQCVKKGVDIGTQLATEITTTLMTERVKEEVRTGLADIIKAAGDANNGGISNTMGQSLGATFKDFGEMGANMIDAGGNAISGILGALTGAAMMPLIIVGVLIVVAVFIFPKLAPKLAAMTGASPGMIKIGGMILFAVIIAAVVWFLVIPAFKSEKRRRNNIVTPAPRQATPPVKTQPMKSPYQRVEGRYFKGERTALEIPSYKKINQSNNFRPPTEKTHTNVYNPTQLSLNTTTVHNPTYHYQNKVEDKPVAYTKKSRV